MGTPLIWKFVQLGGTRKTLQLTGWSAPFGRKRRRAIFDGGVQVPHQTTTYPDGTRTAHLFGYEGKPFEINGRWMDATMAIQGGAQQTAQQWKDFVRDRQEVRVTWGDVISYRMAIVDLSTEYESEDSVVWSLKAVVLTDEGAETPTQPLPVTNPSQYAAQLEVLMIQTRLPFTVVNGTSIGGILNQVSDMFAQLDATINGPFAAVYDTASALTSFSSALSADLQKMSAGIQSIRTSVLQMRDLSDLLISQTSLTSGELGLATSDIQGGIFSGSDMIQLTTAKANADLATANVLALIARMSNEIDRNLRGTSSKAAAARDGDTWEKIALKQLGDAEGARSIKAMNAIRYGAKPVPGRLYNVPKGS